MEITATFPDNNLLALILFIETISLRFPETVSFRLVRSENPAALSCNLTI